MNKIILSILCAVIPLGSGCAQREEHRVVASMPAIEAILSELTAGTSVRIVKLIPDDISLAEEGQFLNEHGRLLDSASRCDAVADMRSIVPEDEVYGQLRKRNIRIVEIDCATPPDPAETSVPLVGNTSGSIPYVWLSVSNCMKMAAIAAKDLERLYPRDSAALRENLKAFKTRYFALASRYESKFATIRDFTAAAMTNDFDYFLKDINLYETSKFPADDAFWPDTVQRTFRTAVTGGRIHTLIRRWKPSGDVAALADSCNVRTAVLIAGDPALKSFDHGLYGLLESNYKALLAAFGR